MEQNCNHFKGVQEMGFVFGVGGVYYYFGNTKLAKLHPNFDHVLTCEMALKFWEGP
jgi:hypothetical protein